MRLIGCLIVALAFKRRGWGLVIVWLKIAEGLSCFLRRILSLICCIILELCAVWDVLLGWGSIKALRFCFDWGITFFILTFSLKPSLRYFICVLVGVWGLFFDFMRSVEGIIAGLHHKWIIMRLQWLLLHLLPLLWRNSMRLIEFIISCLCLEFNSFLRTLMLLPYVKFALPHTQI